MEDGSDGGLLGRVDAGLEEADPTESQLLPSELMESFPLPTGWGVEEDSQATQGVVGGGRRMEREERGWGSPTQ